MIARFCIFKHSGKHSGGGWGGGGGERSGVTKISKDVRTKETVSAVKDAIRKDVRPKDSSVNDGSRSKDVSRKEVLSTKEEKVIKQSAHKRDHLPKEAQSKQEISSPVVQPVPPTTCASSTEGKVSVDGEMMIDEEKQDAVVHESMCFRCRESTQDNGEQLIACDKLLCTKSYHHACLDISKLPHGMSNLIIIL